MSPTRISVAVVLASCATLAAGWLLFRPAGSAPGEKTIVLVTIDTLRKDRVGAYGAKNPTPRIDAVASAGTRFDDARTPVPLTLPAHATMLTGLPPARHGVRTNSASRVAPRARRPFALVAERFTEAGRATGGFVSAGPLVRRYGLDQGFSAYDDGDLDDRTGLQYAERAGAETVARALAWVRAQESDAPLFLWVHLFEPHDPHPLGLSPADAYDADVATADAAVGLLLDGLAASGRGDAALLIAADHGESLGEELGELNHGFLLGESVLRVPLILRGSRVPRGATRADPVDLADVAPTLLALGGLDPASIPDEIGCGRSLLGSAFPADRPRVAEGLHAYHQFRWAQLTCSVVGPWKLEDRGAGREHLFRLLLAGPPGSTGQEEPPGDSANAPLGVLDALAVSLRAYRNGEDRTPSTGGQAAGGYGGGGPVGPLLDPTENARHPDPYEVLEDATRLNQVAAALGLLGAPPVRLEAALKELAVLESRDAGNPSVQFTKGRLLRALRRFAEAIEAFRKAFELGRLDAETLFLWAGSIADDGRPQEALDLLAAQRGKVADDSRVFLLEARLCRALGLAERAKEACARAKAAVRGRRDETLVAEGCR